MIIPDNLKPLPVEPRGAEAAGSRQVIPDDFVSAVDVRKVLLGACDDLPVEGLPANDFDSFAGRADVPYPGRAVPAPRVEPGELPAAEAARVIHPAFEVLVPEPRRAAPPRARKVVDCEANFGRARLSDAWWVLGMGAATAAILFSGTLVDFVARESMRRTMSQHPAAPEVFRGAMPVPAAPSDEPGETLAAAMDPDEEP
ncbi:hypothetical protein [Luteolibacter marinus]|uniref:hypothetical protein n=1 Tax=Luteolibacter marinus TaxID=2776705 RepID=UPI001867604C|nr:hypothetical protein [Luteolibacter marinus]